MSSEGIVGIKLTPTSTDQLYSKVVVIQILQLAFLRLFQSIYSKIEL